MVKLISLFPHKGDDDVFYPAGAHRVVQDADAPFLLQEVANLKYYELIGPVVEEKKAAPVVDEAPVESDEAEVVEKPKKKK
jgi:hypothetical protein